MAGTTAELAAADDGIADDGIADDGIADDGIIIQRIQRYRIHMTTRSGYKIGHAERASIAPL